MTCPVPVLPSGGPVTSWGEQSSAVLSCGASSSLGLCPVSPVTVRTEKYAPTYFQVVAGEVVLAPNMNYFRLCAGLKCLQKTAPLPPPQQEHGD